MASIQNSSTQQNGFTTARYSLVLDNLLYDTHSFSIEQTIIELTDSVPMDVTNSVLVIVKVDGETSNNNKTGSTFGGGGGGGGGFMLGEVRRPHVNAVWA